MWWSSTFWLFKGQEDRTLIRTLYKRNPEHPHRPHPCLSLCQNIYETRSEKTSVTSKVPFPVLSKYLVSQNSWLSIILQLLLSPCLSYPTGAFPFLTQNHERYMDTLQIILNSCPMPSSRYFLSRSSLFLSLSMSLLWVSVCVCLYHMEKQYFVS